MQGGYGNGGGSGPISGGNPTPPMGAGSGPISGGNPNPQYSPGSMGWGGGNMGPGPYPTTFTGGSGYNEMGGGAPNDLGSYLQALYAAGYGRQ